MDRFCHMATSPGGLTSDNEYMSNMRRFQDPNDEWTRLPLVFGCIGANNTGRSESAEKAAQKGWLVARNLSS
jgi:hypothetical protein